jgi:CHAT domain-containing protein/tetratricopeptide (TPR) repeat protein
MSTGLSRALPRAVCSWLLLSLASGWLLINYCSADEPMPKALTAEQRGRLKECDRYAARAMELDRAGKLAEMVAAWEKKLAIEREVLGRHHEVVIRSLQELGRMHTFREDFGSARKVQEEVLAIQKELHGELDWRVTDARWALADIERLAKLEPGQRQRLRRATALAAQVTRLRQQGKAPEALPLARQVRAIRQELLGERHPSYAASLNNLAGLYQDMGDHRAALPLYQRARDLRKQALGEKHPHYAASLNDLALLYKSMGDYRAALPLYQRARDLRKEALGEKHPHYAASLDNLAALYQSMGDYRAALPLYQRARDLRKEALGEKHPDYATSLNNLAGLYKDMGDYRAALPLYQRARDLCKEALGEKHPHYATSLNNLAVLYRDMGDYKSALPLLERARDLKKEALGEKHPHYAQSLENLAALAYARGRRGEARSLSRDALSIRQEVLGNTFGVLSDRQRLDLLDQLGFSLDLHLSVAVPSDAPASRLYQHVLAWKGATAARQAEDRLARDQPGLTPLLRRLRQKRAGLARLASNPPTPVGQKDWQDRFRRLEKEKEDAEVELAQASAEFRRQRQRRNATAAQVARALPARAALVDLLEYTHLTPPAEKGKRWQNESRVLAFILLPGRDPRLVELGAAAPIDRAVRAWRRPLTASPPGPPDARAAAELRRLVWLPLEKHLAGADTILVAPDGALCGLPLGALPGSRRDSFLLEERLIGYVTSGRHLLELADQDQPPPSQGLLALGGLTYGKAPAKPEKYSHPRFGFVEDLPGTGLEAARVARAFREFFPRDAAPRLLSGERADKNALQTELAAGRGGRRWRYLHLATHGFFDPPPANRPRRVEARRLLFAGAVEHLTFDRNPLLLSGLVLSGANRSDDGVLTAEEVRGLDLRGCELAVLSACQTAEGKQAGWQGVMGLQQAFHAAGARALVASLWSVDDAATSVLMEQFYTNLWHKKQPRLKALQQAQITVLRNPALIDRRRNELKAELAKRAPEAKVGLRGPARVQVVVFDGGKPTEVRRSQPVYWAGFVLSGDIR